MKTNLDVWNYYQRCLAYRAVRPDEVEVSGVTLTSESRQRLNELACVLHQLTLRFEKCVEKPCRDPRWIEKHFSKATEAYQQQLKETFSRQLARCLESSELEVERSVIKQQADQDYQQFEVLMWNSSDLM